MPLPAVTEDRASQLNFDQLVKAHPFTPQAAATVKPLNLFLDAATGKISFKDAAGTVNALY